MWAKRDGCRKNQKKNMIILEPKMNGRKKERKKQWPKLGTVKGDRLRNLNEINKYAYIYIYIFIVLKMISYKKIKLS